MYPLLLNSTYVKHFQYRYQTNKKCIHAWMLGCIFYLISQANSTEWNQIFEIPHYFMNMLSKMFCNCSTSVNEYMLKLQKCKMAYCMVSDDMCPPFDVFLCICKKRIHLSSTYIL